MTLAHNCAVLGINADTNRLFSEPWGNYHTGLGLVTDAVYQTKLQEEQRARAEMRKAG